MTTFTAFTTLTLSVALAVLFLAGKWNLFKKMGLAGWKSLIPVYSEYLIFKKAWNGEMFFASLLTSVLCGIMGQLAVQGAHVNTVVATSAFLFGAAATLIDIRVLYKLAKSFGHGVGYTVGLMVAEPLFTTILGLGKSEYARA